MTKFIDEENLAEATKIIKRYIDQTAQDVQNAIGNVSALLGDTDDLEAHNG